MKILLVSNKTYRGMKESSHWYTYLPLKDDLGHEIYWYDTVKPAESSFYDVFDSFKPDLVFCCFTGNSTITPHEPWEEISKITEAGSCKTFNWFCDDTWRFEDFSSKTCHNFFACSTPEPDYLDRFRKEAKYENILLGGWYANSKYFTPKEFDYREIKEILFIGHINQERRHFFQSCNIPIKNLFNISQDSFFNEFSKAGICLNLSKNSNDPQLKTQMKLRPFEIAAGGGLILTENHPGLHHFFEPNKEMITFCSNHNLRAIVKALEQRPDIVEKVSKAGHERFLKDHDSKVRLKSIIEQIMEL